MSPGQIAALVAAAVAVFWALGAYNRLVGLRNAVVQAWAKVDAAQRQRGAALAPLVAALRGPLAAEHGALDTLLAAQAASALATAAMAARPLPAGAAAQWLAAESALTAAASRVLALVEQHPEIGAAEPVAGLVRAWHEAVPRMAFARQLYNEAARGHDEALAQFPTRLLVPLFGFGPAGCI